MSTYADITKRSKEMGEARKKRWAALTWDAASNLERFKDEYERVCRGNPIDYFEVRIPIDQVLGEKEICDWLVKEKGWPRSSFNVHSEEKCQLWVEMFGYGY